jgi:hypothetical protein
MVRNGGLTAWLIYGLLCRLSETANPFRLVHWSGCCKNTQKQADGKLFCLIDLRTLIAEKHQECHDGGFFFGNRQKRRDQQGLFQLAFLLTP